jgi:hypothetical protein
MRKKGMILAALILLMMFPFSGAWAVSMTWDFSSGLDTTMFNFSQTGSFTLNDSGGNLLISKGSGGSAAGALVESRFLLEGNFDIRVDYNLVSPLGFGDALQLVIGTGDVGPSIQLWRDNNNQYPGYPGNSYHASTDPSQVFLGTIQTTDTYGTLELQRTGTSVSALVIHPDGTTTSIYTFPDFGTLDVLIALSLVQTQDHSSFGPMACSFDNLSVTADNIVPLPPSVLLLGSGLLGLVGWRRFRKG